MAPDRLPVAEGGDRVQLALDALAARRARYRATLASSLARVEGMLAEARGADRARGVTQDPMALLRIARAADILRNCVGASDAEFAVGVEEWRTPSTVIGSAFSHWGRAFGSTLAVDLMRTGMYQPAQHDRLTEVWRFEQWNTAHRLAAPPIVAVVAGSDLRVADLAEFLDGTVHIALVVEGDCPPAALVRHITPGTFVLQTSDATGLDRFAAYEGPAIAALVPDTAACFLHDPDAGAASWQRLTIWRRPLDEPRTLGGLSAAQQREELLQLAALAAEPLTAFDATAPVGSGHAAGCSRNLVSASRREIRRTLRGPSARRRDFKTSNVLWRTGSTPGDS